MPKEQAVRGKKQGVRRPLQRFGHWLFNDHPDYYHWRADHTAWSITDKHDIEETPRARKRGLRRLGQRIMHFIKRDHPNYKRLSPQAIESRRRERQRNTDKNTDSNRSRNNSLESLGDVNPPSSPSPQKKPALPPWFERCCVCLPPKPEPPPEPTSPMRARRVSYSVPT